MVVVMHNLSRMRWATSLTLMLLASSAFAQSRAPALITPIPQPSSPVGTQNNNAKSLDTLNRQLDSSSRRLQADTLRDQVRRNDQLMQADRMQTERRRAAAATPAESARIRQEYETRRAANDAWRAGKEQQADRLENESIPAPPPPNEVKAPLIEPRR